MCPHQRSRPRKWQALPWEGGGGSSAQWVPTAPPCLQELRHLCGRACPAGLSSFTHISGHVPAWCEGPQVDRRNSLLVLLTVAG